MSSSDNRILTAVANIDFEFSLETQNDSIYLCVKTRDPLKSDDPEAYAIAETLFRTIAYREGPKLIDHALETIQSAIQHQVQEVASSMDDEGEQSFGEIRELFLGLGKFLKEKGEER